MISTLGNRGPDWLVEFSLLKHVDASIDLLVYYGPRDESPDYEHELEHIKTAGIHIRDNFIKLKNFHVYDDDDFICLLYDGCVLYNVGYEPLYCVCITYNSNEEEILMICDGMLPGFGKELMEIPVTRVGELLCGIHSEMIRGYPADDV